MPSPPRCATTRRGGGPPSHGRWCARPAPCCEGEVRLQVLHDAVRGGRLLAGFVAGRPVHGRARRAGGGCRLRCARAASVGGAVALGGGQLRRSRPTLPALAVAAREPPVHAPFLGRRRPPSVERSVHWWFTPRDCES